MHHTLMEEVEALEVRLHDAQGSAEAAQQAALDQQARLGAAEPEIARSAPARCAPAFFAALLMQLLAWTACADQAACRLEMEQKELQLTAAAARRSLQGALAAQAQCTMSRSAVEREAQTAAARLRHATGALGSLGQTGAPTPVPYQMLHQCFQFKAEAHDQAASAAAALSVLCGVHAHLHFLRHTWDETCMAAWSDRTVCAR